MQSKTSFFNKTVFRKNLTRFAPVWGVYTLCLVLGVFLLYSNGGTAKTFHFARNMTQMVEVMAVVNLGYALVVAQLLFGDLYNSRMCNMLHAFPLRRESWFVTNFASGLVFSLVPTAVMALISLPLLAGSLFEGAWTLSGWIFLASNLQFICYFGMAAFAAMCVANRFTMVAGYGLLNGGAMMVYWLIDTVYTPMLYGVITPTALAENLTPINHMLKPYMQTSASLYDLRELFGEDLKGAFATFTITENWWRLWVLAGVGLVFALLGMLLYRKRDLECAGDAVAFRGLVPVFQVLCSVFVAAAAQFFLYMFLGQREQNFLFLTTGLVTGWIIGKMLVERSTRVFRLKNFQGLAVLAAVFAVSLWLTHIDILGIETWVPEEDEIKSVQSIYFESDYTKGAELTEEADIGKMLRFHRDALENRSEDRGMFVLKEDGSRELYQNYEDENWQDKTFVYATEIGLTYEMENGRTVRRRYNVWVDSEAGAIAQEYLSRWEHVNWQTMTIDGETVERLAYVMENFTSILGDFTDGVRELPEACTDKQKAQELIAAIQADCAEGNMAQHPYFHTGHFRYENPQAEDGISERTAISLTISSMKYSWYVDVYADARHTLKWLEDNGLLTWEVSSEPIRMW